jgi:hypothetical protein
MVSVSRAKVGFFSLIVANLELKLLDEFAVCCLLYWAGILFLIK